MKTTLSERIIAYLVLLSGLSISAVAIYYSVVGLTAIYPAMLIPIVIMGVTIELGKLSITVWLKQNWKLAPWFLKLYMLPAVLLLMIVTSIGVFGFLSKAHSDQNLVSGDVQAKIAVYDEKIKTSKENIDANRRALKQMDEAVDQIMGRSQDEKGADKAVAIRRSQAKERIRLLSEITAEQKAIAQLSEERAPIAAEVRKVEAEVGPIKYIAAFIYGDNPDANLLERAVTWITILIVIVLDPLAIVLLLASQYSFQNFRERDQDGEYPTIADLDRDVGEPPTAEEIAEGDSPIRPESVVNDSVTTVTDLDKEESTSTSVIIDGGTFGTVVEKPPIEYQILDEFSEEDYAGHVVNVKHESYVQNEEQKESNLWTNTVGSPITQKEYIKTVQSLHKTDK
jgi:hypothetical protein